MPIWYVNPGQAPRSNASRGVIGRDGKLQQSWFPANVVPALKIKGFNFSGKTEF